MGESKLGITSEMWNKAWEPTDTSAGNGAGPQRDGKKALTLKRQSKEVTESQLSLSPL